MYIMKSVANETNVKLQEQMEKLDEIYNKVQDT